MNIKEVKVEGLSRELQVSIAASELVSKLDARIEEIKGEVQLKASAQAKCRLLMFVKPSVIS